MRSHFEGFGSFCKTLSDKKYSILWFRINFVWAHYFLGLIYALHGDRLDHRKMDDFVKIKSALGKVRLLLQFHSFCDRPNSSYNFYIPALVSKRLIKPAHLNGLDEMSFSNRLVQSWDIILNCRCFYINPTIIKFRFLVSLGYLTV